MPPLDTEADDGLDAMIAAAIDSDATKSAPAPAAEAAAGEPVVAEAAEGAQSEGAAETGEAAKVPAEGSEAAPQRDEKGRFAKAADQGQNEPEIAAAPAPEGSEPEGPTTQPPHSLAPALKARWAQLSPEVREEFHRLESGFQQAKNEWAPKGQALNALEAVFAPVDQRLALEGMTRAQFVSNLIAAEGVLRTNPLEGLRLLAERYGVNLGQQFASAPPQGQQPQGQQPEQAAPPWMAQFEQQLGALNQKFAQLEQQDRDTEQGRREQEIEAFRSNPDNLYFENVREDMARYISAGLARGLPDAYRMACWARDDIRPLLQAAEAAKAAKVTAAASQVGTPKASPAGAQINGGQPPSAADGAGRVANLSLEEQVAAALEEVAGRA